MTAHSLELPYSVLIYYCWGWLLHCVFMLFWGEVVADCANLSADSLGHLPAKNLQVRRGSRLDPLRLSWAEPDHNSCIKVSQFHFCCSDEGSFDPQRVPTDRAENPCSTYLMGGDVGLGLAVAKR